MLKKLFNSRFVFLVGGLIASLGIGYFGYFNTFFLTSEIRQGLIVSPLTFIFIVLIIDTQLLGLLSGDDDKVKIAENSKFSSKIRGAILYLILFGSAILTMYLMRVLYVFIGFDFRVNALFEISYREIFWFILFINIFISYFIFSLYIYKNIERLGLAFKEKILLVLSTLLFFILGSYILGMFDYTIPIFLSFLIYVFVLDIYMERKVLNSTWIFTFMILIAGFTALILFTVYSEVRDVKRVNSLSESVFIPDYKDKKILLGERVGLYDGDSLFVERVIMSEDEFLSILNIGFYDISMGMYFNPRTGDYIRLLKKYDDKYLLKFLHNRKPVEGIQSIIFYDGKILSNNTPYDKITVVDDFVTDTTKISKYIVDGMSYLMYRFGNRLLAVQVEEIPSILLPFSLFSMLFVLTGIFIFFVSIVNSRIKFLPRILGVSFDGMNSLRERIQFSIIGLVVVSFFVLGMLTFYYILNFSDKNEERNAIEYTKAKIGQTMIEGDTFTVLDKLLYLEKREDARFYLYDDNGRIIEDMRRKFNLDSKIPFKKINKEVLNLANGSKPVFRIDKLLYSVVPLADSSVRAYIGGYFVNNTSISEASEILSNFLNVYVLIFLIAGAIAIALANSISKPVEILGEKLEVLDLSEKNEVLKWDKQDEIGKLISIYNSTVKKLEESAKIITKIERDSAWREMAKQVAHEIKNPLTPLKLNIQYMQGVVANTPERASDMVRQLAPGLIEQIDNLDKIASEFADFAKMPSASNEKIKLNEIVETVHDFFRKREDLDIQLYVPINDLVVFADKNHLVSILNNILKNAIQAIPTDKEGKIVIELYKKGTDAIVKITDNGTGIPDEMISKVFSPNFTTKNSGTGLGLAISVNMIQAFNGKIYFETEVGEGTSFFVEIPLMRIKDNYPKQKRVFLDD